MIDYNFNLSFELDDLHKGHFWLLCHHARTSMSLGREGAVISSTQLQSKYDIPQGVILNPNHLSLYVS